MRPRARPTRSEEHTSELQSHVNLVCRLLLEKKKRTSQKARFVQYRNASRHLSAILVSCRRKCSVSRPGSAWRFDLTLLRRFMFFFFNDTATTEIYTLSLHDALPI